MEAYTCPHCHQTFSSESVARVVICPHCNGMVSLPDDRLEPGTVLGGFEIVRPLGKGGMGHVYLARQSSMNRFVALKVLAKDLTKSRQAVEQFFREMQLSGKLNHPNIVGTIDAGEANGLYYLAMTYVDGEDLEEEMRRFGTINEEEGLRVAARMADALRYAWEHHGLLHKDIKPGNIMRDRVGEVFLMDMGIAQLVNETTKREDRVVGSPFYMSPEQGRGDKLDWRSDCYSLGASLYHMMVGVPPYDDEDVSHIITMHNTMPFPEPATRRPGIKLHAVTVSLLRKMMAKRPPERFTAWEELSAAIAEAEKAVTGVATPRPAPAAKKKGGKKLQTMRRSSPPGETVGEQTRQTVRKSGDSNMALLSYGLLLLIAVVAAVGVMQWRKKQAQEKALANAESFFKVNPLAYDEAIKRFATVARTASGQVAVKADEQVAAVKAKQREYEGVLQRFEAEVQRGRELCNQRQHAEALPVLTAARSLIKPYDPQKARELDNFLFAVEQTIKNPDSIKHIKPAPTP